MFTIFSFLCGQNPEHSWFPDSTRLLCCQRCTGLYLGALTTFILLMCLRPQISRRWLILHGSFLLLMIPAGFHWFDQGPTWRSTTGVLFGTGIAAFLWLLPSQKLSPSHHRLANPIYLAGLAAIILVLPGLAASGGKTTAVVLNITICLGILPLVILTALNLRHGLMVLIRLRQGCPPLQAS